MPEISNRTSAPEKVTVAPSRRTDLRKHEAFHSQILEHDRTLIVYLPPGYDSATRRYPVLYMHDGQNLFDPATAFAGEEWRVDDTADELIAARTIEPLIIVGIYNTGEHRINEYTPSRDPKLGGGQADLYGRMLIEEIKPLIDANYRTLEGPSNTGLAGSSLGGLVTLYLGLQHPGVFGKLAVLSPSVWWNNRAILKLIARMRHKPQVKIWLDMGTCEGGMSLEDTERLRDVLAARGWKESEDLQYSEIEGAMHNESAWAQRVGPMLKYLFPAPEIAAVP
jgi:predicted alpha/beta superfamily hydrolase